jgi:hypothetical protein
MTRHHRFFCITKLTTRSLMFAPRRIGEILRLRDAELCLERNSRRYASCRCSHDSGWHVQSKKRCICFGPGSAPFGASPGAWGSHSSIFACSIFPYCSKQRRGRSFYSLTPTVGTEPTGCRSWRPLRAKLMKCMLACSE